MKSDWLSNRLPSTTLDSIDRFYVILAIMAKAKHYIIKITGNALNIEYYFWWCDYSFGLLIHDALFHFMVSINDDYKYKQSLLNCVGSLSSSKFTTGAIAKPKLPRWLHYSSKMPILSWVQPASTTSINWMKINIWSIHIHIQYIHWIF